MRTTKIESSENIELILKKKLKKISGERDKISLKLRNSSLFRIVSFLLLVIFLIILYIKKDYIYLYSILSILTLLLFIFFIRKYNSLESYKERLESYIQFLKREIHRANGNISELYRDDPNSSDLPVNHYWRDLDIFGKRGLYSYIDTTITQKGNKLFLKQLLQDEINSSLFIKSRQSTINELIKKSKFTWKLFYLFHETSNSNGYTKLNLFYSNENVSKIFKKSKTLLMLIKIYLFLFYSLGLIFFIMDKNGIWGLFFVLQIILYAYRFKHKSIIIKKYSKFIIIVSKYEKIISYLYSTRFQSRELYDRFSGYSIEAISNLFKILKSLESKLIYRDIPLPGFLLNLFFCYDYWILKDIEKIDTYKEVSLSTLIDSVEWIDSVLPFTILSFYDTTLEFPEVSDEPNFSADKIGHPLIHQKNRIYNPLFEMSPGNLMLITGSNMSGKTTYLRTLGLNLLLGQCGAPVFAKNMKISALMILSSIKNEDSLSEGISFFYSEVRKLSYILKQSRSINSIVLIDEILKGTNTRERILATKAIMKKLSEGNSFNYITTHDIELAGKSSKYILKHFTEIVENDKMGFDYMIRDGVITSGNALKILKIECPELEI